MCACGGETARNVDFRNDAILDRDVDDAGSAVEFGARFLESVSASPAPRPRGDSENVIFVFGWHHRTDYRARTEVCNSRLLDRDALREIARLVDVAAERDGEMIGEQLQRDDGQDRHDVIGHVREP